MNDKLTHGRGQGMEIRERWARPVEILDWTPNDTETVTFRDGRTMRDIDMTLPDWQVEEIRVGRRCLNCKEPLEQPWPVHCEALKVNGVPVGCGYAIRAMQAADFEALYQDKGIRKIDPNKKVREEIERLRELDDYESRTGVILPDSVKFPNGVRPER